MISRRLGLWLAIPILAASHVLPLSAQTPPSATTAGQWTGALSFRGDSWPVRLHFEPGDAGCTVLLDLPALVLAREPAPAECSDDEIAVEIPFGLGTFRLQPVGPDSLHTSRTLAGDTAILALGEDRRPRPRSVELTIVSDTVRLAGSLLLPPGPGPHPGVVLIHGSAPMGREDWEYRSWADLFARRGVAALYYDKRGVGESTGDWPSASLDDLAGDALAAVDSLLARPEIDPTRIGLSGGSQAGWIALEAATTRSEDVSFLVLRSAPAVTPAEQEEQSVVHGLRDAGASEDAVQDALAHTRLFFYVARTGRGWNELESSSRLAAEASWGEQVQIPDSLADLAWWRENHDVDPLPWIRELRAATLLLYGEEDPVVPPALNGPIFRHSLPDDTPVRMEIFPHADHGLEIGTGRIEGDRWRFPHKPDRMFDVFDAWLARHVTGTGPSGAEIGRPSPSGPLSLFVRSPPAR